MKVIAWDRRLEGVAMRSGSDRTNIIVDGNTRLQQFVTNFLRIHAIYGDFEKMRLRCHGIERESVDGRTRGSSVVGGYGLGFCNEGITLDSVHLLRPMHGKVALIAIPACRAADSSRGTTADGSMVHGEGRKLMGAIASITGARVMASPHFQVSNMIDGRRRSGEWEGFVYTFNPDGTYSCGSEDRHPIRTEIDAGG